jgi:hypothetical protein
MKGWRENALVGSVAAIVFITFTVQAIAAFFGIPILDGDADFFSPCIFDLATGRGFVHPFVFVIPNNPDRLCIWHGWLYPYLTALFSWSDSYQTINVSNMVLCIISFLISAAALFLISKKNRALAALLCLPIALLVLQQVGRPEVVVTGLVGSAAIALTKFVRRNGQITALAPLLGITAAASPSAGVSYAMLTAALSAIRSPTCKGFFYRTPSIGLISVITLMVSTLAFAPVGLTIWLNGIFTNAITQYVERKDAYSARLFMTYYGFNPKFPMLVIYLCLGFYIFYITIKNATGWRKSYLITFGFVLTIYIINMAIKLPETDYNFILLIPAIVFATAHFIETESLVARRLRYTAIGISAVAAVSLIYLNLTTLISLAGVTQPEFEAGINFLSRRLGMVETNLTFGVPLAEVVGYERVTVSADAHQASYIVSQQANSGTLMPRQIPGFRIIVNRFNEKPPGLFGIRIANTRKDWSYAIYCRNDVCPQMLELNEKGTPQGGD